uniref:Uncharacterized protein n=1 Tax=Picea glauca TaxID=3330 RepID=A0A101M354_PICGL|nr:hypothetical protein ABT39_MTgene3311 [Picea glauca]QHR88584.1 hypothetical protein Q903MT_gene2598 [Picea sitchensis]
MMHKVANMISQVDKGYTQEPKEKPQPLDVVCVHVREELRSTIGESRPLNNSSLGSLTIWHTKQINNAHSIITMYHKVVVGQGRTSHVIHGIMNMTHHVYTNSHINHGTLTIMASSIGTNNRHNIWH